MSTHRDGTRLALLLVAAAGLAGCAGRPVRAPSPAPSTGPGAPPSVASDALPVTPTTQRLGEIDLLLVEWDKAQLGGETARAAALEGRLRGAVDAAYSDLLPLLEGVNGDDGRYLATMALGFAGRPDATRLLVEQLRGDDPRLVANALIALKLRHDPATPLQPLVAHIASPSLDVRRYAPLAFAHVLEARRQAGVAPDAAMEGGSLQRLSASTRDRDVLVRLHAARALGEIARPESVKLLRSLLTDDSTRIQLAAAAALGRLRDPSAFPEVVRMLHAAPEQGKPIVAGVLAGYAGSLAGAPLPPDQLQSLGTDSLAWSRWYGAWLDRQPAAAPPSAPPGR